MGSLSEGTTYSSLISGADLIPLVDSAQAETVNHFSYHKLSLFQDHIFLCLILVLSYSSFACTFVLMKSDYFNFTRLNVSPQNGRTDRKSDFAVKFC